MEHHGKLPPLSARVWRQPTERGKRLLRFKFTGGDFFVPSAFWGREAAGWIERFRYCFYDQLQLALCVLHQSGSQPGWGRKREEPRAVCRNDAGFATNGMPQYTFVNIMLQYTPVYQAKDYPKINRRITREEYEAVVDHAQTKGLTNLKVQGYYRF